MRIYGEITKLEAQDDGTLKVIGVASSGAVDADEERVAPQAMKAALPAYLRFGALREMHGLSAAGATLSAAVDQAGLTRIEAHVVDPLAVKKVRLGVYKGFSIGGRVTARDPDDPKLITGLRLDEISLVDRPCNPEAVIEMWKADTTASPTNAEVLAKALELAEEAGRPGRQADFVVKARQMLIEALAETDQAAKRGARNSAEDLARIQAAHDELVALGARCAAAGDDGETWEDEDPDQDDDDLDEDAADKALAPGDLRRARFAPGLDEEVLTLRLAVADLRKRLDDLAAQPLPPRTLAGPARAVSKAEDTHPDLIDPEILRKYLAGLTSEERGQLELRAALSRPVAAWR